MKGDFLRRPLIYSLISEYVFAALEIAANRWRQLNAMRLPDDAFDEKQLPYKDLFDVDFESLDPVSIHSAHRLILADLEQMVAIRKRLSPGRRSLQYWSGDFSGSKVHCLCDEIEQHYEAEQVLHMYAGRHQYREFRGNEFVLWSAFKARDFAFFRGVELVTKFFISDSAYCECNQRTKRDFWEAVTIILMHSGAVDRPVHGKFLDALKFDIGLDESLLYYLAIFEDYRANHGLTDNGQILGTFIAYEAGRCVFKPPLIDRKLTEKLRKRFGLESLQERTAIVERSWIEKRPHFDDFLGFELPNHD